MLLSTVSFTVMNLLIKYLVGYSAYQLVFFRSIGTLFFTMPFLFYHKIPILGNQKTLLILRGITGVISMGLFFMSVEYLKIGSAVSLRYLSPIFATILAVIFLKEKVRNIQWLFFLIAFIGVLFIKGFDADISTFGLFLIVLSALFTGIVFVLINKIGLKDHPVVIVNYFMWIATILGGILSVFNWDKTPEGLDLALLLSLGIFGYFGQLFMTKAFQSQATNKVVSLKYMEVIFTMIAGIFLFNDIYPLLSVLGTIMVITGLVLNMFYKSKKTPK